MSPLVGDIFVVFLQLPQPFQPGLDRAGGAAKVRTEVFSFHAAIEQAT